MGDQSDRVARERESYDQGDVYEHSYKLQERFLHVFVGPHTRFCEDNYRDFIQRHVKGSVVLDYGCGNGWASLPLLPLGPARLIGIDISQKWVDEALRRATGSKAEFHVMDAHHLDFPDESFDLVLGRAILHHLDFEAAIKEVKRVLKRGGHAAFAEPLGDSPFAKFFRLLTPRAYTPDERALSRRQIEWADSQFPYHEHSFCGLLSTPVGMITSVILREKPNNAPLVWADRVDRMLMMSRFRFWMRYVYLMWSK